MSATTVRAHSWLDAAAAVADLRREPLRRRDDVRARAREPDVQRVDAQVLDGTWRIWTIWSAFGCLTDGLLEAVAQRLVVDEGAPAARGDRRLAVPVVGSAPHPRRSLVVVSAFRRTVDAAPGLSRTLR